MKTLLFVILLAVPAFAQVELPPPTARGMPASPTTPPPEASINAFLIEHDLSQRVEIWCLGADDLEIKLRSYHRRSAVAQRDDPPVFLSLTTLHGLAVFSMNKGNPNMSIYRWKRDRPTSNRWSVSINFLAFTRGVWGNLSHLFPKEMDPLARGLLLALKEGIEAPP